MRSFGESTGPGLNKQLFSWFLFPTNSTSQNKQDSQVLLRQNHFLRLKFLNNEERKEGTREAGKERWKKLGDMVLDILATQIKFNWSINCYIPIPSVSPRLICTGWNPRFVLEEAEFKSQPCCSKCKCVTLRAFSDLEFPYLHL